MNKQFIKAILSATAVAAGIAACFMSTQDYSPRSLSKIDPGILSENEVEGSEEGENPFGMINYLAAIRANPVTGIVSEQEYLQALASSNLMSMSTKRAVNSVWNNLGPDNVGGRCRAFLQDRDTPSIMYVAGVSAGLFRSKTRGSSWVPVNDYQENLNIVSIAQNRDRIIVYGTGEGQFVSITGTTTGTPGFSASGMFRSDNSGHTFKKVAHPSFGNVSSLAAEPKDIGSRFYASTDNGVKYSDDGLTWVNAKAGASKEVKVAVDGTVYAQIGATLQKSTDRGANWTTITPSGASVSRMSIAISPQDANYVYTMVSNNSSRLDGVYRSKDAGATWTKIITGVLNFFDPLAVSASSQGSYNNVISVDPGNKNRIFMGGITLGLWVEGSNPQIIPANIHSDKHIMHWDMSTNPPTFIVGSDGGLAFSSDKLVTFTPKNFGFTSFQAYAVAADYNGNVVGGSQDNGTQYINKKGNTPKSSVEIKGGDGFQVEISRKLNNVIFSESQYGSLVRSRDYGKSQSCIWDRRISKSFAGLSLPNDSSKYCDASAYTNGTAWAPFNTTFRLWEHPEKDSTQSRLFLAIGGSSTAGQIWMAENATNTNISPTWYLIANNVSKDIWDMEVTPDGNSVFIASTGLLQRIDGLNSATYDQWSAPLSIPVGISIVNLNITNAGGRAVTSINLDPNNSNEALITFGNYGSTVYVMKGTNMLSGAPTYTNITNNLPAMPVYDGVIGFSSSNLMFIGTDLGLYASDNGGTSWTAQTNPVNGFPKVATFAVRQYYFPNKSKGAIYAGTHGRGFYECTQYKTDIRTATHNKASIELSAFPNPATIGGPLNVKIKLLDNENISYSIIDVSGKVVKKKTVELLMKGENMINVETSGLVAGVYFLNVSGSGSHTGGTGTTTKPKGTIKLILTH